MIGQFFTLDTLIGLALGYLLGSIPFGLLLTRAAGLGDIRSIGSGNIGATNVLRTGNRKVAAATLVLDALKGTASVMIALHLIFSPFAAATAGLGAVLGHCFPAWLKFKGGKGVATTLGVLFGLSWPFGIAACLLWLLFAVLFRISSLSALLALATTALLAWLSAGALLGRFMLAVSPVPFAIIVTLIVALVMAMHHENIGRLLTGTEPRIGAKS
jgi:acyl phosphate:glycerol-3-phosphate acyltransferase